MKHKSIALKLLPQSCAYLEMIPIKTGKCSRAKECVPEVSQISLFLHRLDDIEGLRQGLKSLRVPEHFDVYKICQNVL